MGLWAKIIWRCFAASCLLLCAKTAGRDLEDDFRAPDALPVADWSVCRLSASCANQRQPPLDLALGDLIKADVPQSFFASVLPFHLHSRDAAFDPDVVYFRTRFVYSLTIRKALERRMDWLDTWAAVHRRLSLRVFDSQGAVLCDLPHNVSALLAPRAAPDGSATSYPVRIDGVLQRTIAWPAVHWARETHAAQRLSLRLSLVVDGADVAADAAATNLLQHARELFRFTVHSAAVAHFPQPGKRRLHDELDARALFSPSGGKAASLHLPRALFDDPCFLLNTSHAALLHKLRIAPPPPTGPDSPWARRRAPQSSLPRVLCVVYTTDARLATQVATQRGTWLRKCTAFLVVANSSRADDENVVDLPFAGEESYANLWQKLRALWKYVHAHYRGAFDWFLVGGDDLYVVAENLFALLASPQVEAAVRRGRGVYAGRAMRFNASTCAAAAGASANACSTGATDDPAELREAQEALYHSGGAGYLLDAAALRVLGRALLVQHRYESDGDGGGGGERLVQETGCKAHLRTSIEDALVGQCLYRLAHRPDALPALPAELAALPPVTVLDTRDALGRERFHVLPPGTAFATDAAELRARHWLGLFANATLRGGADCCAASSVSFHYLFRFWMAAVDAFLYRCPAATAAAFFARHGADFYATHWLDATHTLV
jgi:hypothetical protein